MSLMLAIVTMICIVLHYKYTPEKYQHKDIASKQFTEKYFLPSTFVFS